MVIVKKSKKLRPPTDDELDALSGDLDMTTAVEEFEATRTESMGSGGDFIKLEDGDNLLRFLPPKPGDKVPWIRFFQHRIPGSNPRGTDKDGWDRNIVCPASIPLADGSKRACPICKLAATLRRTGSPNDPTVKANIRALTAKLRIITEVVDVTTPQTAEKGVQLFAYGSMIDDELIAMIKGRFKFNFTSAKAGAPILIVREGQGLDTKYKNIRAIMDEAGPIEVKYLRERTDLSRFMELPTREAMEAAIAKLTGKKPGRREESADEEEEAAPRRPKTSRPSVKEAPKKAVKKKVPDPVEYDEDDDEDEDEDELDDE